MALKLFTQIGSGFFSCTKAVTFEARLKSAKNGGRKTSLRVENYTSKTKF